MISVSEVLIDPDIADLFTVLRRAAPVGPKGRPVVTVKRFDRTIGVVCAAHPNDLERLDDNQRMGRNLSIVTNFPLRGPATGFQPDYIVWRGDSFIVKLVDPYPQFNGFVQAIAGSVDASDMPMPGVGQVKFDEPTNAVLTAGI